MAKKGLSVSGLAMGIIAIVAGVLILFNWLPLNLVAGICLIVVGILAIANRR